MTHTTTHVWEGEWYDLVALIRDVKRAYVSYEIRHGRPGFDSPLRRLADALEKLTNADTAGIEVDVPRRAAAQQWMEEHDTTLSEYDGAPFIIVPDWETLSGEQGKYDLSKEWVCMCLALGVDPEDGYGFSDEWDTCENCGQAVHTQPDSYGWQPDYWMDEENGELICARCLAESRSLREDYVAWVVEHNADSGTLHTWVLRDHPEDYGFAQALRGLQHGLHEGMNDDPHKVAKELFDHDYEVVFLVHPSQFYVEFDVYVRRPGETQEERCPSEEDIEEIRRALVDHSSGYASFLHDYLKHEFKQWPTPAQVMQEALENPTVVHVSAKDFVEGNALTIARAQAPGAARRIVVDYEDEEGK